MMSHDFRREHSAVTVVAIAEVPIPASILYDQYSLLSVRVPTRSGTCEMATSVMCKCRQKSTEMPRSTFCTV